MWFNEIIILLSISLLTLKGAGGVDDPGKAEIEFTVVTDRGECQLPDTFYQIKKYCS